MADRLVSHDKEPVLCSEGNVESIKSFRGEHFMVRLLRNVMLVQCKDESQVRQPGSEETSCMS
jgi:hypothetical protein